jgi:hypothetical protein
MNNIITKTDLTHYVDICKNFEFDQIQYIFQNIENVDLIKQIIPDEKHSALRNMSRNFGHNTLTEAESIYTNYYKMKGGGKSTYDPKNLTFEQKQQRKLDNAAGAKYAKMLEQEKKNAEPLTMKEKLNEKMGIYREDKMMTSAYLRKFAPELEKIKGELANTEPQKLDFKDEHKFTYWRIVEVQNYIAGAKYLKSKMASLLKLTDKPFSSTSEMDTVLKLGKAGVDALIKSFTKVTDNDIKKHKAELEAINNNSPITPEQIAEFKTVTYGQLTSFIKSEKKRKNIK